MAIEAVQSKLNKALVVNDAGDYALRTTASGNQTLGNLALTGTLDVAGLTSLDGGLGADVDAKGKYILNDQTTTNMMSKGTVYRFDGADDYIALSQYADFISDVGYVMVRFRPNSVSTRQSLFSVSDKDSNIDLINFNIFSSVLVIQFVGGTTNSISGSTTLVDGREYVAVFVSDGSAYSFYLDGVSETLSVDAGANDGAWTSNLSAPDGATIGAVHILSGYVQDSFSEISEVMIGNFAPTAAEVKDLISGNIPFKWQWGSQTDLLSGFDFAGDANWVAVGGGTTKDDTDSFTTIAGGAGVKKNMSLAIGQEYEMTITFSSTATTMNVYNADGLTTNLIVPNADGTYVFIAEDSSIYLRHDTAGITDVGVFTLNALGAVALYDQTSISETYWYDKANGNNGAVTGASVLNKPSVSPLLAMHSDLIRINPGTTPGTNITCAQQDGVTWNPEAITDGANIADTGSAGSFALGTSGTVITMTTPKTVVGILSSSIYIHNLNNSSLTEMYVASVKMSAGNIIIRCVPRGASTLADFRVLTSDVGDVLDVMFSYVTST